MADEAKHTQSAHQKVDIDSPAFQTAILDVLVRGLNIAQQKPDGSSHAAIHPDDFCAMFYAEPGNFCLLAYAHKQ